jgi:hypothetical protein
VGVCDLEGVRLSVGRFDEELGVVFVSDEELVVRVSDMDDIVAIFALCCSG